MKKYKIGDKIRITAAQDQFTNTTLSPWQIATGSEYVVLKVTPSGDRVTMIGDDDNRWTLMIQDIEPAGLKTDEPVKKSRKRKNA